MKMSFVPAVALAAALGFASVAVSAQEITLRVADNLPATHFLAKYGTSYFMEEVTKATGGKVKFQYYPSEQLGKAKDMLTILQSGLADIALIVPSYMSEKLPLSGVIDLPGGTGSSCEGTMAYAKLLEEDGWLAGKEFEKNRVRKVFVYVNPPYELFLSGSEKPNLLDLEGRKVRSVGGALDLTVRELNGVPVRMAAPEIRESLSRGTVDGIIFPVPTVVSYKLEGLIKSATRGAKLASVATGYMISDAAWQKLPDDVRKALVEVGAATTSRVCKMTDADISTTYEKFEKDGIDVVDVSDEVKQALGPIYEKVREDWAAGLDRRGLPGSQTLKAFDEALAATF
jgi:TRAP-type C4-dicarboxylate transport system substrate-binding protein